MSSHQLSAISTRHSAPRTQDSGLRAQDPALSAQPEEARRIAVVRPGQLGDLLLAVPGLRALRRGFPKAEIVLIGQQWAMDLPRRFRYFDRVLTPEAATSPSPTGRGGVTPTPSSLGGGGGSHPYDLVLQLQGCEPWAAKLALALRGRITAGYCRDEELAAGFHILLRMRDEESEVHRVLRLVEALGIPPSGVQLEFPLLPEDLVELTRVPGLAELLERRPLVVLHPGARAPARRWPAERFAELADLLYRRWKAALLLTGGPGEEGLAERVRELSGAPAANLAGVFSLGGLAALLSRVELFVGNDSGPAQLAAAVAPRSLRIFGPANPHRWAPLDRANHRMVHRKVECSPCGCWECPIDHRCLQWITVEEVLEEVEMLLGTGESDPVLFPQKELEADP